MSFSRWLIIVVFLFINIGCAERAPSFKTAHSLTQSYFKHYSKKYHNSLLGLSPPQKVEINQVRESSLNHAQTEAFLNLKNGEILRVLLNMKKTPPFGWSITSWEILDVR